MKQKSYQTVCHIQMKMTTKLQIYRMLKVFRLSASSIQQFIENAALMVDVESNQSDMEILHSVIWPNTENKSHISWIYIFQKPTQGLLMAMYLGIQCDRRAVCSLPFYLLVYYLISQFFTYLSNVPLALQHCISQLMAAQPVMLPDL